MRLDTHQHFWRYKADEFPWIQAQDQHLARDFLPDDLAPLLQAARMEGCIAVQARCLVEETDFLLALADDYPWIMGVVGWVELRHGDATPVLEKYRQKQTLKGIRHILQDEADCKEIMEREEFLANLKRVQEQRLVYEVLLKHHQLKYAGDFCSHLDQFSLVLDHIGKPPMHARDHEAFASWRHDIKLIAKNTQVFCKISGLVTEMNDVHAENQSFFPYLDACLDLFGIDRIMFGSDWPVCNLVSSYAKVVEIIESWSSAFSADEKAKIWGQNAQTCYSLKES